MMLFTTGIAPGNTYEDFMAEQNGHSCFKTGFTYYDKDEIELVKLMEVDHASDAEDINSAVKRIRSERVGG
jgi:hypothetical protein